MNAHPALNRANRFAHIDAMRAFAVLLVVLAHSGLDRVVPGGSGVTIFFSISGYIITSLLLREKDRTDGFHLGDFYLRRAVKLAPPFLVAILLPSLVALALGANIAVGITTQTLFSYNWAILVSDPEHLPGSRVVWSLAIEEQFYIVFALVWLLLVRTRNWVAFSTVFAAAVVAISTVERLILATAPDMSERIYYGTDTRADAIALGILLAVLLRHHARTPMPTFERVISSNWLLVGAACLYLASLVIRDDYFRDTLRYSMQSLSACAAIAWGFGANASALRATTMRFLALRPIQFIGLASYSIYLAHLVVIAQIEPVLPPMPAPLRIALLVAAGLAAGCLLYLLVEKPVAREFARRRHPHPVAEARR